MPNIDFKDKLLETKNTKIIKNKPKIALATQGSQGIIVLRELFSLGYVLDEIDIFICKGSFNSPLIEFLKYLNKDYKEITNSKDLDKIISLKNKDYILLSISYKFLISKKVLESFNYRAINFHPGLLPNYKGCFSSSWSLINKEKFTGFTYHFINEKFDSGNIIHTKSIKILDEDDAFSLHYKIFQQGILDLDRVLKEADLPGEKQLEGGAYYSNHLPHNGEIQINWDDEYARNFIRAMYFPPYPSAFLVKDGKNFNIETIEDFLEYKNG
tara:strand:+ start:126 stop:935 length:810 start_codon:yes stop_codon:yes gene_type:complete